MPNQPSSSTCGGDKGTITPERKEGANGGVEGRANRTTTMEISLLHVDGEDLDLEKRDAVVVI
ncbi:hypothetical protein L195_g027626 [Trifolium pratense]|uniref:Uncharacterized protein n=1 Tax=Trifolium pratense TaxID=57577 RepID=A0A2K3KZN1_TRIPR|nr:hypothetical protein L195_g027626 [Trifolium pratense]